MQGFLKQEPTTVIPRNALIEANQSGLIAEPLIDITPQTPIPDWKVRLLLCGSMLCSAEKQSC